MSEVSCSHTGLKSSVTNFKKNVHRGHGGTIPKNISQQYKNSAGRKKSNIHLNDQLIPKPTDINVAEKMIKTATLKEHPYSSHICRFAMFPSFRSPDDPETGVRAALQPFLNPHIPNRAPDVVVLSKTIGGPYRHEILKTPEKTRKYAAMWTGEKVFQDKHIKPSEAENQVFYPTPPKTILPNSKLRSWDLSLSERTNNMLRNLEKTLWITSYQMNYTGSGPANPLNMDDFKEKISGLSGIESHSAPLVKHNLHVHSNLYIMRPSYKLFPPQQERSYPVFISSKPKQKYGIRQRNKVGRHTCGPSISELRCTSPAPLQSTASAIISQHRPQEIPATHNEAPFPNQMGHVESENRTCATEMQHTEQLQKILRKQQTPIKSFACEGRKRENCKVWFDERSMQELESPSSQEANSTQISNTEHCLDLYSRPHSHAEVNIESTPTELCAKDEPSSRKQNLEAGNVPSGCKPAVVKGQKSSESHSELISGVSSEQEGMIEVRELLHGISNPCIWPRPLALPDIYSGNRQVGAVDRVGTSLSLQELQNSFSKSEAHKNFNNLVTHAAVNLRDNVVCGKKHNFYGINCNYIHG